MEPSKPVWVEDEGRMVGEIHVPGVLFDQVRVSADFRACVQKGGDRTGAYGWLFQTVIYGLGFIGRGE